VTRITASELRPWDAHANTGAGMEKPSLQTAITKLAIAGEQAGFTVEQMIELLNQALTVLALLDLIQWRLSLHGPRSHSSSHWAVH
jgi:hypothetical protein